MSILKRALLLWIAFSCVTARASDAPLRALLQMSDMRVQSLHSAPDVRSVIAVVRTAEVPYRDDFVGLGARVLCHVDLQTRTVRLLTKPEEDAHAPAWSPDGKRIAFFTRGFHLVKLDLATGERTIVTSVDGPARNPVGEAAEILWAPDGETLAFAVQPNIPWSEHFIDRTVHAPASMREPVVVDGTTNDSPLLRAQGVTAPLFMETPKVLRIGSRVVTTLRENVRFLAFNGDEVLIRDAAAIQSVPSERLIATLEGSVLHSMRTADGWVFVSRKGDEWIVAAFRNQVLKPLGRTPVRAQSRIVGFTGKALITIEEAGTLDRLVSIDLKSGKSTTLLDGTVVRRATVLNDRVLAVTATATEPETLQLIGKERTRIGHWPGVDATAFGGITARTLQWTSGGASIEGLYVAPSNGAPKATLLFLHGGPESRITADAHLLQGPLGGYAAILARSGYAVLLPNFRNGKDLGNGRLFSTPAADALAGMQKLVDDKLADPQRLGIYGFSYGAMLTAWIVARDHRFRAAAVSAATLDMLTDDRTRLNGDRAYHAYAPDRAGPEDHLLDHWLAPEKYRELSPLERARDVRTPMLLVSTAAEQLAGSDYAAYFNALRINKVPVQWAYYPAAWHGGSWSIDDRLDTIHRLIAWFSRVGG